MNDLERIVPWLEMAHRALLWDRALEFKPWIGMGQRALGFGLT